MGCQYEEGGCHPTIPTPNSGLTPQELIPPLTKPGGDLAITTRENTDLLAHHFNQKMKTH